MRRALLAALAAGAGVRALLRAGEERHAEAEDLDAAAAAETERFNARFRALSAPVHRDAYIFVVIYLSPNAYWKADFIRNTSMTNLEHRFHGLVDMKFIVGTVDIHPQARTNLLNLQKKHGDYLLLDIPDTYEKLTRKTAALIQYIANDTESKAKYILKVDDDSYVHLGQLIRWLRLRQIEESSENTVYGLLRRKGQILRPWNSKTAKWWEPNYPGIDGKHYPVYADGGGYIFTRNLAKVLAHDYWDVVQRNIFHNEDASLGIWNHIINKTFAERSNTSQLINYVDLPLWKRGCRNWDIINGDVNIAQFDCFWMKEKQRWKDQCCPRIPPPPKKKD